MAGVRSSEWGIKASAIALLNATALEYTRLKSVTRPTELAAVWFPRTDSNAASNTSVRRFSETLHSCASQPY
jgi:hypothetical protein